MTSVRKQLDAISASSSSSFHSSFSTLPSLSSSLSSDVDSWSESRNRLKSRGERIREAAQAGDLAALTLLAKSQGPQIINDQDTYGTSALMIAASIGSRDIAEELLRNKANVNLKDKFGSTALVIACSKGHYSVAELLIENKANVNIATSFGHTPLIKAASVNHIHSLILVQLLVRSKAKVDAEAEDGSRAVHYAVRNNNNHILHYLIEKGANINAQTKDGTSLLMIAAQNKSMAMISELISLDADPLLRNKLGQDVYDIAIASDVSRDKEVIRKEVMEAIANGRQLKIDRAAMVARNRALEQNAAEQKLVRQNSLQNILATVPRLPPHPQPRIDVKSLLIDDNPTQDLHQQRQHQQEASFSQPQELQASASTAAPTSTPSSMSINNTPSADSTSQTSEEVHR